MDEVIEDLLCRYNTATEIWITLCLFAYAY